MVKKSPKTTGLGAKLKAAKVAQLVDNAPHLIVEALAGTGKTTTLIEALKIMSGVPSKLTPSPQQQAVWDAICLSKTKSACFVAFNSSIAEELKRRVPEGMDAMTIHSMGNKALFAAFGKLPLSPHRVSDIVEKLMPGYKDVWEIRRKRPGLLPLAEKLVGLCKMNLLDGDEQDCYGLLAHHDLDPGEDATVEAEAVELVPHVMEACADVVSNPGMDFNDMIWLPVKLNLAVKRYDLLLVDECQDLNRCQQALVKRAGKRFVLVGDSHQAIYGFAGADAASMARMKEELSICPVCLGYGEVRMSKDGQVGGGLKYSDKLVKCSCRGCQVLPLTVTRRCGRAIVAEAKKYVPSFEAHETNGPGLISRYTLDPKVMPTQGSPLYPPGHCAGGYHEAIQDGDMVLCRLNAPLVSECFKFLKAGRKATIRGRDVAQGLVSTIKGTKAETITDLIHGLGKWVSDQTAKEQAKKHPSEEKLLAINDRYDCIMAFVEGQTTVASVLGRIELIFTDNKDAPGIKLSSIHKSKGLESKRVFLVETEKSRLVMELAKKKGGWQYEQENNLRYVSITRAIEELCFVS